MFLYPSISRTLIRGSWRPIQYSLMKPTILRNFHQCIPNFNEKSSKLVNKPTEQIQIDKSVLQHIPGELRLTNEIQDRMPKFPLSKEALPTLLPRPGVPRAGVDGMTFGKMINILHGKSEPELIYDLEPHKLYFVICGCFALVFAFYAWNIAIISFSLAWEMMKEDHYELPIVHQYINSFVQFIICGGLTCMPLAIMVMFIMAPTRLIRRMWYIPGEIEKVQFITHPLLPSSPSPVITIPLANLSRAHKTKVWTGRGFYGTIDNSIFFFLREKNSKIPWIVDRKGFFWGDGRVFDYLFGKESVEEAELGLSMDERVDVLRHRLKEGEAKLKRELGLGWRYKAQAKLMKEDINRLKQLQLDTTDTNTTKKLPKSKLKK